MRSLKRTIAFTATAACLLAVSAATLATGSAALHAAATAAHSDYRNAIARCARMNGGEQRRCVQDADAARNAAVIRPQDAPGDAQSIDLNFLPAAEGTQGGAVPPYRELLDLHPVPDYLAVNTAR
jgi:hypothetical protein